MILYGMTSGITSALTIWKICPSCIENTVGALDGKTVGRSQFVKANQGETEVTPIKKTVVFTTINTMTTEEKMKNVALQIVKAHGYRPELITKRQELTLNAYTQACAEIAKEDAIAFVKWLSKNSYELNPNRPDLWLEVHGGYTTEMPEEAYEQFKSQSQKDENTPNQ